MNATVCRHKTRAPKSYDLSKIAGASRLIVLHLEGLRKLLVSLSRVFPVPLIAKNVVLCGSMDVVLRRSRFGCDALFKRR